VLSNLTDTVVTMLSDWIEDIENVRSSAQRTLMLRIKDVIDRRLADPDLGPERIAAAVNISTRYLHKLFADDQWTVSQHIRRQRLERCRADLTDPRRAEPSISSIALRWGFGDLSGFNRAFRAAFDATPSDLRAAHGVQSRVGDQPLQIADVS
jgi:AraC-like DNA-binding protein